MTSWTIKVEEDPETGDLILPFTDEILDTMGWKEGDNIEIGFDEAGRYVLKKI